MFKLQVILMLGILLFEHPSLGFQGAVSDLNDPLATLGKELDYARGKLEAAKEAETKAKAAKEKENDKSMAETPAERAYETAKIERELAEAEVKDKQTNYNNLMKAQAHNTSVANQGGTTQGPDTTNDQGYPVYSNPKTPSEIAHNESMNFMGSQGGSSKDLSGQHVTATNGNGTLHGTPDAGTGGTTRFGEVSYGSQTGIAESSPNRFQFQGYEQPTNAQTNTALYTDGRGNQISLPVTRDPAVGYRLNSYDVSDPVRVSPPTSSTGNVVRNYSNPSIDDFNLTFSNTAPPRNPSLSGSLLPPPASANAGAPQRTIPASTTASVIPDFLFLQLVDLVEE